METEASAPYIVQLCSFEHLPYTTHVHHLCLKHCMLTLRTICLFMQAESFVRLQALHAMLDAAMQPDSSEATATSALLFVGDQVASMVQSSAHESDEQQAQLQQLMYTSMIKHKVTSVLAHICLHRVTHT